MRTVHWCVLVALVCILGAPAAESGESQPHAAVRAAERALEALKVRMDARIKEGELLARAGRIEEALEAYRSIGQLYERGMGEVRELIAELAAAAPTRAGPAIEGRSGPFGARPDREGPSIGEVSLPKRNPGKAVEHALRWLAAHQAPDGRWGASEFADWCDGKPVLGAAHRPDGAGKGVYDVGVSGLALLAFLGAGHTDRSGHPHSKVVARGLKYLLEIQDAEGCFGSRKTQQYIYNHGIATLAVTEAYGMTSDPRLRPAVQKALDFIAQARNPHMAWRYGVRPGDNDTSVTTWMVMALKSADLINKGAEGQGKPPPLRVDEAAFDGARTWLDKVTDPDYGRVGYVQRGTGPARPMEMIDRFPGERSEAMTAAGVLMRIFLGEDPRRSALVRKGADLCAKVPPSWNLTDGSIDMIYWYYGTLALYQVGGKHWKTWRAALDRAVVPSQRLDTTPCLYKGSWDPVGVWGMEGGRVAATAFMTMMLEVLHRHAKVFGAR